MALTFDRLADIQYVASSAGALITNGSGEKRYIRGITLFNGNTTPETVKLYNVPDNALAVGTAGAANQFFEQELAAKETLILEWTYPITLEHENDTIQGATTTASKVTVQFHGSEA
jgi:hypothetical protein